MKKLAVLILSAVLLSGCQPSEESEAEAEQKPKPLASVQAKKEVKEEEEAKPLLTGEWSSSEGYYLFLSDGTYEWYQNESKDKQNVVFGTWEESETQLTMNKKSAFINGKKRDLEGFFTVHAIKEESNDVISLSNQDTGKTYEIKRKAGYK